MRQVKVPDSLGRSLGFRERSYEFAFWSDSPKLKRSDGSASVASPSSRHADADEAEGAAVGFPVDQGGDALEDEVRPLRRMREGCGCA